MPPHFLTRSLLAWCCALPALPAAAQTLTVAWRDKPPYHYTENGVDQGFLLARAHLVFDTAGIRTVFVKEPTKRIFANFKAGMPHYCSIGWYYLDERAQYAQYSAVFHTDRPQAILVAPSALAAVNRHATLAAVLADPALTLAVVDGVSYGPQVDKLIAGSANLVLRRTVDPAAMVRMIALGRASFAFYDREDWDYAVGHDARLRSAVLRDFPDMPPGLQRHILCSKDVPAELMARINKAIEQVRPAN